MNESMDEAIIFAKKYIEDTLSFFGLNTDVHDLSDDEKSTYVVMEECSL